MTTGDWATLAAAIDRVASDAGPVRFWLRDDDAATVTPALQQLAALVTEVEAPVLLAVIPADATSALGAFAAGHPWLMPCQHGFAHRNWAASGERACELGGARSDAAVLAELAAGQAVMTRLFGAASGAILVPPWNRMRPSLAAQLPAQGYRALSTFAGAALPPVAGLPRLDCDLDIIDWRNGRRGRDHRQLCDRLTAAILARPTAPIGILAHHLVHDGTAWSFLEQMLALVARHPGAAFVGFEDALDL